MEELARVDGGTGVILSAHVSLGSWPIFAYGTEEPKKKYLVPLAKAAGAAIGSSRPVAETLKYLPLNRYVGMSGQKLSLIHILL